MAQRPLKTWISALKLISVWVESADATSTSYVSFIQKGKQEKPQNIKSKCKKMSNFQDLPDELVLIILKNVETKDLISCGQVSRRIRKISHDGSLWVTANLERKIVKTELLQMILCKGCKFLDISNSTIVDSLNSNELNKFEVYNCGAAGRVLCFRTHACEVWLWPQTAFQV